MSQSRAPKTYRSWSPDQDDWLRVHALDYPVPQLIVMMRSEFDIERTYESIAKRKHDLGLMDFDHTWLSSRQTARVLGVAASWMWTIRTKRLIQTYPANRKSRRDVGILPSDLEDFVRREHLRLNPETMPPSRYRSIVEMEYRTNRYMTVPQVARALGIGNWTDMVREIFKSGAIPAVMIAKAGRNGGPRWVAKQADVLAYLAERDQAAA